MIHDVHLFVYPEQCIDRNVRTHVVEKQGVTIVQYITFVTKLPLPHFARRILCVPPLCQFKDDKNILDVLRSFRTHLISVCCMYFCPSSHPRNCWRVNPTQHTHTHAKHTHSCAIFRNAHRVPQRTSSCTLCENTKSATPHRRDTKRDIPSSVCAFLCVHCLLLTKENIYRFQYRAGARCCRRHRQPSQSTRVGDDNDRLKILNIASIHPIHRIYTIHCHNMTRAPFYSVCSRIVSHRNSHAKLQ